MEVKFDIAVKIYESLRSELKSPSLHPKYVVADSLRSPDLKATFFVYSEKNSIFYHAFHMVEIPGMEYVDIQSPYGYGGPIVSSEDPTFFNRAYAVYESWCNKNKVLVELIRFHPLLKNSEYYSGVVTADRHTVWLQLDAPDLLAAYKTRVRTAIRKALAENLIVKWVDADSFYKIFPQLYWDTMAQSNASEFYYFNDAYFSKLLYFENTRFAVCFKGRDPIAAALFLIDNQIMEYHLSASTLAGKKYAATNLILHEAALLGKGRGCKALHMGGGKQNCSDCGIFFFKAGYSKDRGIFKLGYKIHDVSVYSAFKKSWQNTHNKKAKHVLFYRANYSGG